MTTRITPRLGAIVLYTLGAGDVTEIVQKRLQAGRATRSGNDLREGDTFPAMIVRDFVLDRDTIRAGLARRTDGEGNLVPVLESEIDLTLLERIKDSSVNLQVFLDGNDTYWATSRSMFDPTKHGSSGGLIVDDDGKVGEGDFRPDPRGHWQFNESSF